MAQPVGSARCDVATIGQEISMFAAVLGQISATLETPSTAQFSSEAVNTASWITDRAEAIFRELEEIISSLTPATGADNEKALASMSIAKRVKTLEEALEDARSRFAGDIARERKVADEALHSRVQLQRDLDWETARFTEERKVCARLQDELQEEVTRTATERKSKENLQAELKEGEIRHSPELNSAAAKLDAELKIKELLQAELEQEKERWKKVIQLLNG
ncbi:hypothetical protein B0T21DRAFT_455804 [Apiosordaria backusii]|uniref:Uncharacterized protein n=1 Tax=Apiosordaria backusii TaxID=314023 RepID=A0AA39ZQG3_9PEZI|nr:hypothetical protein B0T21DRAFT_455804 [Apiosordaria backusii]